ncbi:MAG: MogA/MoaB family molybdenum cofactor biosynthesis protein [Acidobacteriales bacterium]|nr:MogA/MoaB family molybdenum cofactor biosynthesis protein [Terriglobales bacterium]
MTSSSTPERISAAVLTVSDSCSRGERRDLSGPAVSAILAQGGFDISAQEIVPDEKIAIHQAILRLADTARVVITTGGTGIADRDVTPEATQETCSRMLPGIPERMRIEGARKTPFAALSRGVCGVCKKSVVLNLPGSLPGAVDSLSSVIELLPHIVQLLNGNTTHDE